MPMIRRLPRGVSPRSRGASSVTRTLKRNSVRIISVRAFPEQAKKLALRARRPALGDFLAGTADERAQRLQVRAGVIARELGQRGVVGEQPLAPLLQPPVARA